MNRKNKLIKCEELKKILIFTFIFGFIVHSFGFLNANFNHDSIVGYNQGGDISWKFSLGRFMQFFSITLRGHMSTPLVTGMIGLLFLGLSVYLINDLLKLKKLSSAYMMSAIFITSVPFIYTSATYFHETDAFMISLFISVLTVYVFKKYDSWKIICPILLMISVGFYQAYITVALGLFVILILEKLFNNIKFKELFIYCLKISYIVISSLLLYFIVNKLVINFTGVHAADGYNSISDALNFNTNYILLIINAYKSFIINLFKPYEYRTYILISCNALLFLFIAVYLYKYYKNKKVNKLNTFLILVLLTLFPLFLNIIYVISKGLLHGLMIFGIYISYVFLLYLMDKNNYTYQKWVYTLLIVLIFNGWVFTNGVYYNNKLTYENTALTMNRIISDLEDYENYKINESKIMFIGNINKMQTLDKRFFYMNSYTITYPITYSAYFRNLFEYKIDIERNAETVKNYYLNQEVIEMPSYPEKGYINNVDEYIVIKLSNIN